MTSLRHMLERNAALYPQKEAIVFAGHRVTFKTYAERALKLADSLGRIGVRKGDRVAILAMNCVEYLETYAACELAGFIVATVNFRLSQEEVAYVLIDAAPKVLIFEEEFGSLVMGLRERYPNIQLISVGAENPDATDYHALLESGTSTAFAARGGADDYAHLIYTSGTTGRPKGVVRRQRAACAYGEIIATSMDLSFETRSLITTPLFHVGAKAMQIATHLRAGTVIVQRGFDAAAVLRTIQSERATSVNFVPTTIRMALEVPGVREMDLSCLRTASTASAPISTSLLKQAIDVFGPIWVQSYGMTEAPVACIYRSELKPEGTPEERKRVGSVGHAMPQVELRIIGDDGADCPPGTPGEVVVRTPALFDHYWNNSVATIETLRDGWAGTGDIGVLDDDGYLYLVDRKKDMIISGGENIYSREVEIALEQHPLVSEAAVIGVAHAQWGEAVKAIVVVMPQAAIEPAALIEFTRERIARYKCPKSIHIVDDLPRLGNGKVNKAELRRHFAK